MSIVQLAYTNCGGPLEFPEEFDNISCPYCNSSFVVQQYKGIRSLRRIEQSLDRIERHTERSANATEYMAIQSDISIVAGRIAELEMELDDSGPPTFAESFTGTDEEFAGIIVIVFLIIPSLIAWWLGFTWWYGIVASIGLIVIWNVGRWIKHAQHRARIARKIVQLNEELSELEEKAARVRP